MRITAKQLEQFIKKTITESMQDLDRASGDASAKRLQAKIIEDLKDLASKIVNVKWQEDLDFVDGLISDAINHITSGSPRTQFSKVDPSVKVNPNDSPEWLREARGEGSEVGTGVPDAKKVVAILKKFDDLIEDTIKKARDLADEGEDLIQTNLLSHPEVGTRNEILKNRSKTARNVVKSVRL